MEESKVWNEVEVSGPRPRTRCGATLDIIGDTLYLFGGQHKPDSGYGHTILSDMAILHLNESPKVWTIIERTDTFERRSHHVSAVLGTKLLL